MRRSTGMHAIFLSNAPPGDDCMWMVNALLCTLNNASTVLSLVGFARRDTNPRASRCGGQDWTAAVCLACVSPPRVVTTASHATPAAGRFEAPACWCRSGWDDDKVWVASALWPCDLDVSPWQLSLSSRSSTELSACAHESTLCLCSDTSFAGCVGEVRRNVTRGRPAGSTLEEAAGVPPSLAQAVVLSSAARGLGFALLVASSLQAICGWCW